MKKQKMTIEQLAEMVKHGFDQTTREISVLTANMDEQFAGVDERFTHIDERFTHIDERFAHVDGRLDHIDARLGRLESDVSDLRGEIIYRHEFEDALARIKYIERKLSIESGVE